MSIENPQIGDTVYGRDIGKTNSSSARKYIWIDCKECGKQRWVTIAKKNPEYYKCKSCARKKQKYFNISNILANPKLGDECRASDLGKLGSSLYVWAECIICHKQKWFYKYKVNPEVRYCDKCKYDITRGDKSPSWKGGRCCNIGGYVLITLSPDDYFMPMTSLHRRVLEHRLVMAKHLGRCLESWEIVHHKNGDKQDNRIENLELTTCGQHTLDHNKGYKDGYMKGLYDGHEKRIKALETRVTQLEAENVILKTQLEQPCYQP